MAGSDRDMVDSIPSTSIELKGFSIVQQGHSNCFFKLVTIILLLLLLLGSASSTVST